MPKRKNHTRGASNMSYFEFSSMQICQLVALLPSPIDVNSIHPKGIFQGCDWKQMQKLFLLLQENNNGSRFMIAKGKFMQICTGVIQEVFHFTSLGHSRAQKVDYSIQSLSQKLRVALGDESSSFLSFPRFLHSRVLSRGRKAWDNLCKILSLLVFFFKPAKWFGTCFLNPILSKLWYQNFITSVFFLNTWHVCLLCIWFFKIDIFNHNIYTWTWPWVTENILVIFDQTSLNQSQSQKRGKPTQFSFNGGLRIQKWQSWLQLVRCFSSLENIFKIV